MTTQPLQAEKIILGYQLQERIGSGGFGEVWSAIAPGGMRKAVKVIYGFHDEKRAQAELKALDRVKEVRHPFLLSLERIEIHDGQLIVVTELADQSLADVFSQYLAKNEIGIPRDELLKYIRSVADALDYLADKHGLQHLDVKPENLLMVSGHVKVADFGLIKDLHDASQSLMSGMTPAYAAPELFDGRPGVKSDQYSLAIVYQEMLTGVRPFPGSTPAQLAAQHVHGKPNLRSLPQSDQSVISRALSKDPADRFENCRELAEELSNRKRSTKKVVGRIQSLSREYADTESNTLRLPEWDATAVVTGDGLPFQAGEIRTLDPPQFDDREAKVQPTLLIGIGSTANRVLKQVKQQIVARHHSMNLVPALRIVCIDSDRNELSSLCRANDETAFSTTETLATPLSKPEQYRGRSQDKLTWLSRRWIYNIPRSLQTEGLRPLGRLAFSDHFDPICQKLESALKQIIAPEPMALTAETLAMNPGDRQPRVMIVTSISGGVGSGMVLDVAYTVKLLMAEMGLRTNTVAGIMLHSSYQRTRDRGLAAANACAFLTELRHFVENGYPGDETLGLPEFENEPPFDFTYFQELGNDLSQTEFDAKLHEVAEYVFLSTLSKCSLFFDSCRALEMDSEHFALRTFGLSFTGPRNLTDGLSASKNLALGLTQRWVNGPTNYEFDGGLEIEKKFAELGLLADDQHTQFRKLAKEVLGSGFDSLEADAIAIANRSKNDPVDQLINYLDGAVGCPPDRLNCSHADESEVCLQMKEHGEQLAQTVGKQIEASVTELLHQVPLNLKLVSEITDVWQKQIETAANQIKRIFTYYEQQTELALQAMSDLGVDKATGGTLKRRDLKKWELAVIEYVHLRREEFGLRFLVDFYRTLRRVASNCQKRILDYSSKINGMAKQFLQELPPSEMLGIDSTFCMDQLLADSIDTDIEKLISQTETQVYQNLVKEMGGYPELLDDDTCLKHHLPAEIGTAAQRVLADAYKKLSLDKVIADNNLGLEQIVKWMNEKMRVARPKIDNCGGASRVLLGLPSLSSGSSLENIIQQQFGLKMKTIRGTCGDVVFCFEGENLSLGNVVFRLLAERPDAIELVKRIHARSDVKWTSMSDLL